MRHDFGRMVRRLMAVLCLGAFACSDPPPDEPPPPPPPGELVIVDFTLPQARVGERFDLLVRVTGGVDPVAWTFEGSIPGVAFASDGRAASLRGVPSEAGSFEVAASVTDARAKNVRRAVTVVVDEAIGPPVIDQRALPGAVVGAEYSTMLSATGGVPPLIWSVAGLPQGLDFDATTNTIHGTSHEGGTFSVSVAVQDELHRVVEATFDLDVVDRLAIPAITLPHAREGFGYAARILATGGKEPHSWRVTSGALPTGLTLGAAGTIFGTPAAGSAGDTLPTFEVRDAIGQIASITLRVHVDSPPTITTASFPPGQVGDAYVAALHVSGGSAPFTWTAVGLPMGLTLDSSTSADTSIRGVPAEPGIFSIEVSVADALQNHSTTLEIAIIDPYTIVNQGTSTATVGEFFSLTLVTAHGVGPHQFARVAGSAPPGIVLAPDGSVSGIPLDSGRFVITVAALDSAGHEAFGDLVFEVANFLEVALVSGPPQGNLMQPYSATFVATRGSGTYEWSISGDALPAGLVLVSNGAQAAIEGAPETTGTFAVVVTVDDGDLVRSVPFMFQVVSSLRVARASDDPVRPVEMPSRCGSVFADLRLTPATGRVGELITLDGSASIAAGKCSPQYTWSITGPTGTSAGVFYLSDRPEGLTLPFLAIVPGNYTVTLRALFEDEVHSATTTIAVGGPTSCSMWIDVSTDELVPKGGIAPYAYTWAKLGDNDAVYVVDSVGCAATGELTTTGR